MIENSSTLEEVTGKEPPSNSNAKSSIIDTSCSLVKPHLVVCLDRSRSSEILPAYAIAFGKALNTKVTLLNVLEPPHQSCNQPAPDPMAWELARIEATSYLEEVKHSLSDQENRATSKIVQGYPAEAILRHARESKADILLLSTHGEHGQSDWHLSSTVQKVISRTHTSLLVVPGCEEQDRQLSEIAFNRILVPLDGSLRAESVLAAVVPIARAHGSEIILTQIVSEPKLPFRSPPSVDDRELMNKLKLRSFSLAEEYLQGLRNRLKGEGLNTRLIVEENSDIRQALVELGIKENVDLAVFSAHGHTCNTMWPYGNVSGSILSKVPFPLLVIQDLNYQQLQSCQKSAEVEREPTRVGSSRFND